MGETFSLCCVQNEDSANPEATSNVKKNYNDDDDEKEPEL